MVALAAAMTAAAHGQTAPNGCCSIGSSVSHPEAITGHWEMLWPGGSIIGLSIFLETSVWGSGMPPSNVSRTIESTYIVTYVRDGPNNSGGEIVDGSLSVGGTVFSGGATHYGNGVTARGNPPLRVSWILISGPSCSDSRSSSAAP
jgi:hypothetical protein